MYAPGATFTGTGTVTESAGDSSGYADNSTSTLASDGSWQPATGSGWAASSGFTQWGYSAAGAYGYAIAGGGVTGVWQQSGSANTTYNNATNYTQSGSGDPAYTGGQSKGQTGGRHSCYSGSGSYAINSSPTGGQASAGEVVAVVVASGGASGGPGAAGATFTGGGAVAESGSDNWGYGYSTQASMNGDGSWQTASGAGWGSGSGSTQWGYSASGAYQNAISGSGTSGSVQGAWQQSGSDNAPFTDAVAYVLSSDGSTWLTTGGSWDGSDTGGQSSSYSGSGSYAVSSYNAGSSSGGPPTGGPGVPGATAAGTGAEGEAGSTTWGYGYTRHYAMGSGGSWQSGTGSGSGSGSGVSNISYSASGTYGYALSGSGTSGSLQGTWQQARANTAGYTDFTTSVLNADGSWTTTGGDTTTGSGATQSGYSGSGSYAVYSTSDSSSGGATVLGAGTASESGADQSASGYAVQYALSGSGGWQAGSGSASGSDSGFTHSSYSASGGYSRALPGGALQGTWGQNGNADAYYADNTTSARNGDGSWTTTGSGSSSGDGVGSAWYSGSGSFSQSSASGDAGNGSDSYLSGSAGEGYSQGWSYQYYGLSALSSGGQVTTSTSVSASGSASGSDAYAASGGTDVWSSSGGYASESHDAWGLAVAESGQAQWQQAYTTVAGPAGATTVGGASGSSQASGTATSHDGSSGGWSESVGSGSGMGAAVGGGWSSGVAGQDYYNDLALWSQTYNPDGTLSWAQAVMEQVWGSATSQWTSNGWGSLSGAGSASVWNLGGSSSTAYNVAAGVFGFYGGANFLATPGAALRVAFPGPGMGAPAALLGAAAPVMVVTPAPAGPPTALWAGFFQGWGEANSFGLWRPPAPATPQGQVGRTAGHLMGVLQGLVEMGPGAGAAGAGVAGITSETGPLALVAGGVTALVVEAHGAAVAGYSTALVIQDIILVMSSVTPPPGGPTTPGAGGSNPAPNPGRPRIGQELGRGAEGVVYENLDQPGWVVKEFNPGGGSPRQAQNEFDNLERARAISPDNVVEAQAPANPRQGWLVKQQVYPSNAPPDMAARAQLLQAFQNIQEAAGNLIWGTTAGNASPRWILIE